MTTAAFDRDSPRAELTRLLRETAAHVAAERHTYTFRLAAPSGHAALACNLLGPVTRWNRKDELEPKQAHRKP
jgi:hypothetical protein